MDAFVQADATGSPPRIQEADVIVAGSLAIDLACDYICQPNEDSGPQPILKTSNPASITQTIGGVASNVATAISYLGVNVCLCSRVGDDLAGQAALNAISKRGLSTSAVEIVRDGSRTAQYVALNDTQKDLVIAMADMEIFDRQEKPLNEVWRTGLDECKAKWLVVDANWDAKSLRQWIQSAKTSGAQIAFEPVSIEKSKRLFASSASSTPSFDVIPNTLVHLASPNALELASMFEAAALGGFLERGAWFSVIDSFGLSSSGSREKFLKLTNTQLVDKGIPQQSIQLLPYIPTILTTLGRDGVLLTQALRPGDARLTSPDEAPYILGRSASSDSLIGGVYMRMFPPKEVITKDAVVSVNGVGDTFLAAIIAGLAKTAPKPWPDLVDTAQNCSALTLKSKEAISPEISILRSNL